MTMDDGQVVNTNSKCKATLTMGIMIVKPLKNGSWQPFHVNNDSLLIELDGYNDQDLIDQVYSKIRELKEKWANKTVSMENVQTDAKKIS